MRTVEDAGDNKIHINMIQMDRVLQKDVAGAKFKTWRVIKVTIKKAAQEKQSKFSRQSQTTSFASVFDMKSNLT